MKVIALLAMAHCAIVLGTDLPSALDLRDIGGKSFVSAVKKQNGGTCWTHGTHAAVESNLLLTGTWQDNETGDANLAEYHLDWWNGFNKHYNADIEPEKGGLPVHQGGDYRVAAAYFARGGAVRDADAPSYNSPPAQAKETYHHYYARHIEWYSAGKNNEHIDRIKLAIRDHGVIGTALAWSSSFFRSSDATFYQPPTNGTGPNHAVAIVGWDDEKKTAAPKPGAWLVKNSWGSSWGKGGYFWISYYDKVAGRHPEMGAVSFREVEPLRYDKIYSHDYHGWRDTKTEAVEAFNAFVVEAGVLRAVSFYTATDHVEYQVRLFRAFENGQLTGEMAFPQEGLIETMGFHTVELQMPVPLTAGQKLYVAVRLSKGGHPFDKTSNVPVLLGGDSRPMVKSAAKAGESFYRTSSGWTDLTTDDKTANFCIKALVTRE